MTDSRMIHEYDDDDGNENGEWPYATVHKEYEITGELADSVRAASGKTGTVTINETITSGGYSEYTQEDYYEFEVLVDGATVFRPDAQYGEYSLIESSLPNQTTFAQFNEWLNTRWRNS